MMIHWRRWWLDSRRRSGETWEIPGFRLQSEKAVHEVRQRMHKKRQIWIVWASYMVYAMVSTYFRAGARCPLDSFSIVAAPDLYRTQHNTTQSWCRRVSKIRLMANKSNTHSPYQRTAALIDSFALRAVHVGCISRGLQPLPALAAAHIFHAFRRNHIRRASPRRFCSLICGQKTCVYSVAGCYI